MQTKKPKLDVSQKKAIKQLSNVRAFRQSVAPNQSVFWNQYGVTQSGGSRYEGGRNIPTATRILMALHTMGVVSDEDLARATAVATKLGESYRGDVRDE